MANFWQKQRWQGSQKRGGSGGLAKALGCLIPGTFTVSVGAFENNTAEGQRKHGKLQNQPGTPWLGKLSYLQLSASQPLQLGPIVYVLEVKIIGTGHDPPKDDWCKSYEMHFTAACVLGGKKIKIPAQETSQAQCGAGSYWRLAKKAITVTSLWEPCVKRCPSGQPWPGWYFTKMWHGGWNGNTKLGMMEKLSEGNRINNGACTSDAVAQLQLFGSLKCHWFSFLLVSMKFTDWSCQQMTQLKTPAFFQLSASVQKMSTQRRHCRPL